MHPSEELSDDFKDEPIFKWQSRLQRARIYLKMQFGHEDIFDNLGEFDVPEHFLLKTKDFLVQVIPAIGHQPQSASRTIADIQGMSFGYVNITG
jgi:hypothetical protein